MKRKTSFFIISCLLFTCIPHHAEAQFWKRLFKKHKHQHADSSTVSKSGQSASAKKKAVFEYPQTQKKEHYRIDLLVPFYLNELVKDNKVITDKTPEKASAGLEFFKGIKLAADSLNKRHYVIDIYVHDITDTSKSLDKLIRANELKSSDLIIGALQAKDLPEIASYAKNKHINFISAFSPSDGGVAGNPYFTMLQPSLQSHCEKIKETLVKRHAKKRILLFYRSSNSTDASAYTFFTKNESTVNFSKLQCDSFPQGKQLKVLFDSVQLNVIVLAIFDVVYAEKIINKLSSDFPSYKFEMIGMPSWKSLNSLSKKDVYPNMDIVISEPFYFDHANKQSRYLEKAYRKEYGGKPGELAYRGYETLFWYSEILLKYGTIFNNKMHEAGNGPFTKFMVKPRLEKNLDILYLENQHVYFYRYNNGKMSVEQ